MHRSLRVGLAVAILVSGALVSSVGSVAAANSRPDQHARDLITRLSKAPSLEAGLAKFSESDRKLAIQVLQLATHRVTVAGQTVSSSTDVKSMVMAAVAVKGAGCWTWGPIENTWYNLLGWKGLTYSNKFDWCSDGYKFTSGPNRKEYGSTYLPGWVYNGIYQHPTWGGTGQWSYNSFSQGSFNLISTPWFTVQSVYPWIDAYAYANATTSFTEG
jgi:hypothetical protein